MQIEAGLLSTQVRFEKLCKNYALRILKMQNSHPVKQRISNSFSFFNKSEINLTELNSNNNNIQLTDWNQSLFYSESESEPEYRSQRMRKKRKKNKKQRKY